MPVYLLRPILRSQYSAIKNKNSGEKITDLKIRRGQCEKILVSGFMFVVSVHAFQ